MSIGIQLRLGIAQQACAFGQVLMQQPTGILVEAPLPGPVRIGKEYLDRETVCHPLVFRHLFALIVGQRFLQWGGHKPELLRKSLVRTRGGQAVLGVLQQVAFLVARHRAGGHLGGAVSNRRDFGKLAA
jgi:hypothetical protein